MDSLNILNNLLLCDVIKVICVHLVIIRPFFIVMFLKVWCSCLLLVDQLVMYFCYKAFA